MTEYVKMESAIEVLSGYKFPNAKTEREREVAKSLSSLVLNAIPLEDRLRWTPCNEGLPEEDGNYLVTEDDGHVCIAPFEVTNGFGMWVEDNDPDDFDIRWVEIPVVAWMPLFKPYKEGAE